MTHSANTPLPSGADTPRPSPLSHRPATRRRDTHGRLSAPSSPSAAESTLPGTPQTDTEPLRWTTRAVDRLHSLHSLLLILFTI